MVDYGRTIKNFIIPLIVFPTLTAIAFHFIFGHLFESGLGVKIENTCLPQVVESTPYRLNYTGIAGLDRHFLCTTVSFFHAAFDSPDALAFLAYFVGVGAPVFVIPAVEGCRTGRSIFIAFPILFGCLCQTLTVGVTMPLYWLIFILCGVATLDREDVSSKKITQAHAEAVVFGIIIGLVVPSAGMLVLLDPYVTAIWQAFPIYISTAQFAHLALRPASRHPESGYNTIRALYIGTFIICSSVHISTIWPAITDIDGFKTVFLPSITVPHPLTTMQSQVLHFLKWDFAFGLGSSILATLWFANSREQLIFLVVWNLLAVPVFGPGAAVMGAALLRESSFQEPSTVGESKTKAS